jgi:hypothetical protein
MISSNREDVSTSEMAYLDSIIEKKFKPKHNSLWQKPQESNNTMIKGPYVRRMVWFIYSKCSQMQS